MPFAPSAWTTFAYRGVEVSPDGSTITCRYALLGDDGELPFVETFTLDPGPALPPARRDALHRVARLLWFAAGLSYYKTAAPPEVAVPALTPAERAWLEPLYREGLGEFAFENGIDLSRRPVLNEEGKAPAAPPGTGRPTWGRSNSEEKGWTEAASRPPFRRVIRGAGCRRPGGARPPSPRAGPR